MRRIKKTISMILAAAIMASMCGCGNTSVKDKTTEQMVNSDNNTTAEKGKTVEPEKKKYMSENLLDNVESEYVKIKTLDEEFIISATDFSINILKESTRADLSAGKNVMVSPDSIMTCLAMTANGAGGETLSDIEKVICPGLSLADFNEYLFSYNFNREDESEVKFNSANSIWIRNDEDRIKVNEDFLKKVKTYYDAGVYKEDFSPETAKKINTWVKENTNNMIDKVVADSIDEDIVMYLINAIAFEGEWNEQYENSQVFENEKFTNSKGESQNVVMLRSHEECYMTDGDAEAFLKYYKGCKYAFMGILPKEGITVNEYIEGLTGEKFKNLYADRHNYGNVDVSVAIPEFKSDYDLSLKPALGSLGMSSAFKENADFKKMADTTSKALYINDVIHKTHIELDRKGTKAAAVTVVEMTDCAAVSPEDKLFKEIILDRPFVYAIVDVETGLPIFIGALNSVE